MLVAEGRSLGNLDVEKGRVLYLAGENPDDVRGRWIAMAERLAFDIDGIPVKAGAPPLALHDNGRPRELILARSHAVSGRRYDSGTLLRFDRDGRLTYVQP